MRGVDVLRIGLALLLWGGAAPAEPVREARLGMPVAGGCVTSGFGPRVAAGGKASRMHAGIDLRAAAGARVVAVAAGRVVAVRRRAGLGLEVDVRHADGTLSRYAHLGMVAPAIASGATSVAKGSVLGRVGRTGVTYGTHLHFEWIVGGQAVDPAQVLAVAKCA